MSESRSSSLATEPRRPDLAGVKAENPELMDPGLEADDEEMPETLEPHEYIGDERYGYLDAKWLTGKSRWPKAASAIVKDIMLSREFYSYHRNDTTSTKNLTRMLRQLQLCIVKKGWVKERHNPLLRKKVIAKIHRTRQDLLQSREIVRHLDGTFKRNPDFNKDKSTQELYDMVEMLSERSRITLIRLLYPEVGDLLANIRRVLDWAEQNEVSDNGQEEEMLE